MLREVQKKCTALREFLATQLLKPRSAPQVESERLPLLKNDKMAREIGDRKLAYVSKQSILGNPRKQFSLIFFF